MNELEQAFDKKLEKTHKEITQNKSKTLFVQNELNKLNCAVSQANALQINNAINRAFESHNQQLNKRFE